MTIKESRLKGKVSRDKRNRRIHTLSWLTVVWKEESEKKEESPNTPIASGSEVLQAKSVGVKM